MNEKHKMTSVHYKKLETFLLAVDCIIFGFDGTGLKVLLIKRELEPMAGKWSLVGGFVKNSESVNDAAMRVLMQLTGLKNIFMEQLHCYGSTERDPGGRVVSVAYFALIRIEDHAAELLKEHNAKWVPLDKLPKLIFDHNTMLDLSKERLRQRVANHPIGFELLPEKFTLPQLQNLYEAIYESQFDKRNFNRKILGLQILKKLEEKDKTGSRKGAFYYVFDSDNYKKLESEGISFI